MVPEMGAGRGQARRVRSDVQRWRLTVAQTRGRLDAQKAFPGLEPEEAGSEGNKVSCSCMAAKRPTVSLL